MPKRSSNYYQQLLIHAQAGAKLAPFHCVCGGGGGG